MDRRLRGAAAITGALEIGLLGTFRLALGGAPYAFTAPPRTAQLLAYLILRRAEPVSREKLAGLLFPDHTDQDARTDLRRHLYYLDRALAAAGGSQIILNAGAKHVRWQPAVPCVVDVEVFERLIAEGRAAEAIEYYGGDLLECIDEEWLLADRERLRRLYASALFNSVASARAAGDLDAAISYAERLLQHDPWREDAIRELMLLRYEQGDGAGALSTYLRFAKQLAAEMRVDPMPETAACYEAIAVADVPSAARTARVDVLAHGGGEPRPRAAIEADVVVMKARKALAGDLSLEWLKPFMRARSHRRGTVLFKRGDIGKEMFFIEAGTLELVEFGSTVEAGELCGEIALFAPDRRRTATARCATDVELLAIGDHELMTLCYRIPEFAFFLVQLITKRLLRDVARARNAT